MVTATVDSMRPDQSDALAVGARVSPASGDGGCDQSFPQRLLAQSPRARSQCRSLIRARRPHARACARGAAPLLYPHPLPTVGDEEALTSILEVRPSSSTLEASKLVDEGEPALLRGAWESIARPPSWSELRSRMRGHRLDDVTLTRGRHYLPADSRAVLHPLLGYHADHAHHNLTAESVLSAIEAAGVMQRRQRRQRLALANPGGGLFSAAADDKRELASSSEERSSRRGACAADAPFGGRRLVWFGGVPAPLKPLLQPADARLYATSWDAKQGMQYAWLSSPGMRTHTHFDNDRNLFVQLLGAKRFVIWPPNQTDLLCPYPRLHPLWHSTCSACSTDAPVHEPHAHPWQVAGAS